MNDRHLYRAWHIKQKKMIHDVHKSKIVHHALSGSGGEMIGFDHYLNPEWFILIQSIGARDKNKDLIFEKDILGFPSGHIVVVEHKIVEKRECFGHGDYGIVTYSGYKLGGYGGLVSEAVILGNIFENPELLKDTGQ